MKVIHDTLEKMKLLPESENKRFAIESSHNKILFNMDERYLKRAVENLIANCIKHNPPGTKIKVILYQDVLHDNEIQIIIEDDGIGMDEETVECLFDRYFRGTSATSNNSGTGLEWLLLSKLSRHMGEILIYIVSRELAQDLKLPFRVRHLSITMSIRNNRSYIEKGRSGSFIKARFHVAENR